MSKEPQDELLVDRDDAVLRVTFHRPATLNSLTLPMLVKAGEIVDDAGHDPAIRAIVITGAGRAFSTGADLGEVRTTTRKTDTIDAANAMTMAIRRAPKPVIAAVNGPVAGVGCSFVLAADYAVAAESAYFMLAFTGIGLMPDGGATDLLPAAIGRARALRMALLAERIPAGQALGWGLIAETVPDAEFPSRVETLAARLATGPTLSYAKTKFAINANTLDRLPEAFEIERVGQTRLFDTKDFAEGLDAFKHRRPPLFAGA